MSHTTFHCILVFRPLRSLGIPLLKNLHWHYFQAANIIYILQYFQDVYSTIFLVLTSYTSQCNTKSRMYKIYNL